MIVLVWGTRPESIKLGPVAAALRDLKVPFQSIATGQHTDLLRGTPAETDLADSQSLGLAANGDPLRWVEQAVPVIAPRLREASLVVVQGDTSSALAGARVAHGLGIPIAHVEAGLRSGDLQDPWPEEGFRREITELSTWHFAPTQTAYDNLVSEGVSESHIFLTGNPVVSALERYANANPKPPQSHILLTMHRREWLQSVNLPRFMRALHIICNKYPEMTVIWPVHPAVDVPERGDSWKPSNLCIIPPLPYVAMIDCLSKAHGLASDSGGLVEEAATLGIPTAILRNHNDRPEAVEAGIARQFAPTDLESAFAWLTQDHPRIPTSIYGFPTAAEKIAHTLTSCT